MKAKRAAVALSVAAVVALAPVAAIASNGADDPAGHDARDGRVRSATVVDRRGHDDPQRDDHGRGAALAANDRGRAGNDDPTGDDHGRRRAEPVDGRLFPRGRAGRRPRPGGRTR